MSAHETPAITKQPKILFILADGMVCDRPNQPVGQVSWDEVTNSTPTLAQHQMQIDGIALSKPSPTGSGPDRWRETANVVKDRYADYDGFVITDNFLTSPYHAAALSYMLQGTDKPVILTHATMRHLDAHYAGNSEINIVRSAYWAGWTGNLGERVRGASIFHCDRLVQGNRAQILSHGGIARLSFVDVGSNNDRAAYVWQNLSYMSVQPGLIAQSRRLCWEEPTVNTQLSTKNMVPVGCTAFNLVRYSWLNSMLQSDDGPALLVITQSNFEIPSGGERLSLTKKLYDYADQGGLVCVVNQLNTYDPDGSLHEESAQHLLGIGLCPIINLTPEAAWAKMAYAMGQRNWSRDDKKNFMINPIARDGAVDPRRMNRLPSDRIIVTSSSSPR